MLSSSREYPYIDTYLVMGFHTIALVLLLLCMVMVMVEGRSSPNGGDFNVVDFGAVGDGVIDDSKAFLKAWEAICGSSSQENSGLIVPGGKTFLVKKVTFQGPCKCPSINFQVLGKIIAPDKENFGSGTEFWLTFTSVNGLILSGDGDVDGYGSSWWGSCNKESDCFGRPPVLTFNSCNNLQVSGVSITNAPRNHISITNCATVIISNIKIITPDTTPNTDGIDITESTRIQIQHSNIKTGDDCIAINTGCSYINVTGVNCGPGHGISIGSLGENQSEGTVEEVHVVGCTFTGTQNAARIKTWQGGSGYARKISFEDITLDESMNPIFIDQYYCEGGGPCKNQTSAVAISDISFIGFTGTSATEAAVQLDCSQSVGCTGILLDRINITASANKKTEIYSTCINAHGTSSDSNIPAVPCLLP